MDLRLLCAAMRRFTSCFHVDERSTGLTDVLKAPESLQRGSGSKCTLRCGRLRSAREPRQAVRVLLERFRSGYSRFSPRCRVDFSYGKIHLAALASGHSNRGTAVMKCEEEMR